VAQPTHPGQPAICCGHKARLQMTSTTPNGGRLPFGCAA
jgi:hypothetical protein